MKNGITEKVFGSPLRMGCACLVLFFMVSAPHALRAQHPVEPLAEWLATVDEATQRIVLRWSPSTDSSAMGYHICTGSPCLDYDTVFGRMDTMYVCADHDPLDAHTYRLHVFDSNYNVSALTPSFGNMVLTADVPECATEVSAAWTPYTGMPSGVWRYVLMVRQEPYEDDYAEYYRTDSAGSMSYSFEMPEGSTRVHLKVLAYSRSGLVSQSNVVRVERRTVDSAAFVEIEQAAYDSVRAAVCLTLHTDTSFHADRYTLWRSIDGTPWRELAVLSPREPYELYVDADLNVKDSLHCYQLSVSDACGMNEKYSATRCVVVPEPPDPEARFANAVVAGDSQNGTFRPRLKGWDGETYELTIYNRNGMQVFVSHNPEQGWCPSADQPQGAYAYVARVGYSAGIVRTYTGSVVVIK